MKTRRDGSGKDVVKATKNEASQAKQPRFTPEKQKLFLTLYAAGGSVAEHAQRVGVSSVTIYNYVRHDPAFARGYRIAQELNTDQLEDRLYQMATRKGVSGNITALFGVLRARRPAVYKDNLKVEHSGSIDLISAFALAMDATVGGVLPDADESTKH